MIGLLTAEILNTDSSDENQCTIYKSILSDCLIRSGSSSGAIPDLRAGRSEHFPCQEVMSTIAPFSYFFLRIPLMQICLYSNNNGSAGERTPSDLDQNHILGLADPIDVFAIMLRRVEDHGAIARTILDELLSSPHSRPAYDTDL